MTAFAADPAHSPDVPTDDAQPEWERVQTASGLSLDVIGPALRTGEIGIAVLLDADSGRRTWDASCEQAFTACEMEVLGDQGPGITAIECQDVIRVADLRAEARWSRWCRVAMQLQWRTLIAAPLMFDAGSGAVVVYGRQVGALDPPGLGG